MEVPYLFDRIIVVDSGAAERGRQNWTAGWVPPKTTKTAEKELRRRDSDSVFEKRADEVEENLPVWAAPFVGLKAPEGWWLPTRTALLSYLGIATDLANVDMDIVMGKKKGKGSGAPALTYVSMQDEPAGAGPRLNRDIHDSLVRGLRTLQNEGVLSEVNIVRGNGSSEVWEDRMNAIARSGVSFIMQYSSSFTDFVIMCCRLCLGRSDLIWQIVFSCLLPSLRHLA